MPQRFLRPGITNSERWNSIPWDCQSLYVRILTLVDDFGRADGRPSVIWGQCFPVWNEKNPDSAIDLQRTAQMLQRLAAVNLIELYEVGGKKALQVTQWQERVRDGAKEKWPKNPNPQESAAARSVSLPPSSPPSPPPAPPPADRERALADVPTFGDVCKLGDLRGIPRESCQRFFDHHQGNNLWINRHGALIDWHHKLTVWGTNDRQSSPGKLHNNGKTHPVTKVKALDDEISRHPANPDSLAFKSNCTPDQRADLKALRAKRNALNAEIARA